MWFENKKHCRTASRSLLNEARRLLIRPLPGGTCTRLPMNEKLVITSYQSAHVRLFISNVHFKRYPELFLLGKVYNYATTLSYSKFMRNEKALFSNGLSTHSFPVYIQGVFTYLVAQKPG